LIEDARVCRTLKSAMGALARTDVHGLMRGPLLSRPGRESARPDRPGGAQDCRHECSADRASDQAQLVGKGRRESRSPRRGEGNVIDGGRPVHRRRRDRADGSPTHSRPCDQGTSSAPPGRNPQDVDPSSTGCADRCAIVAPPVATDRRPFGAACALSTYDWRQRAIRPRRFVMWSRRRRPASAVPCRIRCRRRSCPSGMEIVMLLDYERRPSR
jgi:hypothetical protein